MKSWIKYARISAAGSVAVPEQGEGLVAALNRPAGAFMSATFPLRGLRPDASYQFLDLDGGLKRTLSGASLTGRGLELHMPDKPRRGWSAIAACPTQSSVSPMTPVIGSYLCRR